MKATWKHLSRPLRLAIAAPWCLLAALAGIASTPATRTLLLDAANKPTADVSLASPHWTGTLADARLSPNVPLLTGDALDLPGQLHVSGPIVFDQNLSNSDGSGNLVLGNSLYLGDSTDHPSIHTPSGAFWQDDGIGGWASTNWNLFGDGSFNNANGYGINSGGHADVSSIGWPGFDPTIEADFNFGYLRDDGVLSAYWTYSGVGVPNTLTVGQLFASQGDAVFNGNTSFYNTVTSEFVFLAKGDGLIVYDTEGTPHQVLVSTAGVLSTVAY